MPYDMIECTVEKLTIFNPLGSAMFIMSLNNQVRLKCRYNL